MSTTTQPAGPVPRPVPPPNGAVAPADASQLKVLLVEDEDDIRELVRRYLEGKGMRVMPARHGEEGWDIFQKGKPDVVVTDLLVPLLNGRQLVERIRREGHRTDTPIVMISASFLNARDEANCLGDLPVQAVFRKPLSLRDLAGSVVELGQHHRRVREAEQVGKPVVVLQAPPRRSVTHVIPGSAATSTRVGALSGENTLLSLAGVANRCFQQRVDGVLEVINGDAARRILFHDGLVVATSSSVVEERLNSLLRDAGLVGPEQDELAQHVMAREGGRYGYAVARAAGIPPSAIAQALEEQTLWVTIQALSQTSGTWSLKPSADNPVLAMQLRMDPLEAMQRAALDCVSQEVARGILARFGTEKLVRTAVHEDRVLGLTMLRPGTLLPPRLDDEPTLEDAIRRAGALPGGINQLLALVVSGAFTAGQAVAFDAGQKRPPVLGALGGQWRPHGLAPASLKVREDIALEWLRTGGCKAHQILKIAPDAAADVARASLKELDARFSTAALDTMDLGPAKRVLAVVRLRIREAAHLTGLE